MHVPCRLADSIVAWDRDQSTGALTNQKSTVDHTHLKSPHRVVVSPDDLHVFAICQKSNTVVHFNRDPSTGTLSNQVYVEDGRWCTPGQLGQPGQYIHGT